MRIAYFGLPLAALLFLADGHEITSAVISRADAPGMRRLRRKLGRQRVALRSAVSGSAIERLVGEARPDLVVSWFWTTKLSMAAVRAARLGGIGAHPSLLPRHRGPDPYFAAIDQGDEETGVTVHRIEEDYDTGAMLGVVRVRIDPAWNAWQLAKRLDGPSLRLLRDVVGRMARGEQVRGETQDEAQATLAPEPGEDDCGLRWSWPTARILRRIRALAPTPGAFTTIGEQPLTVLRARAAATFPRALAPGEAAVVAGTAIVRTGDTAVELLSGEIDGISAGTEAIATLVANARKMIG